MVELSSLLITVESLPNVNRAELSLLKALYAVNRAPTLELKMGMIAAEALLRRIARPDDDTFLRESVIAPEMVVGKSTARCEG